MKTEFIFLIAGGISLVLFISLVVWLFSLRRIVPTNVVHIVQKGKSTVSYGVGKGSNTYYEFPSWMPLIGVVMRWLPVSNFGIDLFRYSAYDKNRVPFEVDVKAFFHIADTNKAAEKVSSFEELKDHLTNIVQGAIRSILAKSTLEEIMEERSIFGEKFTESVKDDLKNWGVEPVKSIELMDVRDTGDSNVIHQIMAKKMSAIETESRTEVAQNKKKAKQAELEAEKEVEITTAETNKLKGEAKAASDQAIGIAQAESLKNRGIAEQNSLTEIATAKQLTAEKEMEVLKTQQVKQAEINKESALIDAELEAKRIGIQAEADRVQVETAAEAKLAAAKKESEGTLALGKATADVVQARGLAEAEAKKASELASVVAQTALAKEIGQNPGYQTYLINLQEVEVKKVVGVAQAENLAVALSQSEVKFLINSGDVNSGMSNLMDIFTSKGASALNGFVESLVQTEQGKAIVEKILPKKEK